MRRFAAPLLLSLLLLLAPSRARADSLVAVLEHAGVSFVEGFDLIVTGMGRHVLEMARRDPELALKLHTAAEGSRIVVENLLRQNAPLRVAVARRIGFLVNNLGLRGPQLMEALGHGRTYRNMRAGSANPMVLAKIVAVAVTAHVSFSLARGTGNELLRITQSHAKSAEAEAYAERLLVMLDKLKASGNIRLCRRMSLARAAQLLRRNMQSPPYRPYRNLLCARTAGGSATDGSSVVVQNLRSGYFQCTDGWGRISLKVRGQQAKGTYTGTYNTRYLGTLVFDLSKRNGIWGESAVGRKGRFENLQVTGDNGFTANWHVLRSSPGSHNSKRLPVSRGVLICQFASGF